MKLEIKGMSFGYSYGGTVLKDINLELSGPELVCIIGPNGVGKSTLVKCINRLVKPGKGTALLDGVDVSTYSRKDLAMRIGYVPPESSDMFSIPVLDAIMIGRHNIQGWRNTETDVDAVYGLMKLLGIEGLAMRNFNRLSSGQRQMVSIARGLAMDTPVLILDEPTSNLDVRYQVYVIEMLRGIAEKKNRLIIMISHDINIAAKYADEIVVMSEPGTVYAHGRPKEVITRQTIRDVYGVDCEIEDCSGIPHAVLGSVLRK